MSHPARAPSPQVALSTGSVYPESTARAFEIASRLGYSGLEVMVSSDPVSQDPAALRRLSDHYQTPIVSIHAPCLLVTQRVWTTDPWVKLEKAGDLAAALGAGVVVVHPPFRWQRDYVAGFDAGIARMTEETGVVFAVENMFPWRVRGRELAAYLPDWNVANGDYAHCTLDISHTSTAQIDALALLDTLADRLAHVHLADGSGSNKDEHLVPGRGAQPCAEVLAALCRNAYSGSVVLEVNTRRAMAREQREADLSEALAFARWHLAAAGDGGQADGVPGQPAAGTPAGLTAAGSGRGVNGSVPAPLHAADDLAAARTEQMLRGPEV